jgi:hypothetical protein
MSFLNRAEISYKKGDVISTVITLIEGVKKNPDHTQAFRWMIDLYCDEVENIGLEEDIVVVIDSCEDPEEVYTWIYKRLQRSGKQDFIKKLDRARRQSTSAHGKTVLPLEDLIHLREQSPKKEEQDELKNQESIENIQPSNIKNKIINYDANNDFLSSKEKIHTKEKRDYFVKEDKDSLDYYSQDIIWPKSNKIDNVVERENKKIKNKKSIGVKIRSIIFILFVLTTILLMLYFYII